MIVCEVRTVRIGIHTLPSEIVGTTPDFGTPIKVSSGSFILSVETYFSQTNIVRRESVDNVATLHFRVYNPCAVVLAGVRVNKKVRKILRCSMQ